VGKHHEGGMTQGRDDRDPGQPSVPLEQHLGFLLHEEAETEGDNEHEHIFSDT